MSAAIQTFTGIRFSPLEPVAADVAIEDIAHAPANLCRFGGHCMPHPLKHRSALGTVYREIEAPLQAAICGRFGLPPEVKAADRAVLASERQALMHDAFDWPELAGVEPVDLRLEPWFPVRAEREFLERFAGLEAAR